MEIYNVKKQDKRYKNKWTSISYHSSYEKAINKLAKLEGIHKIDRIRLEN